MGSLAFPPMGAPVLSAFFSVQTRTTGIIILQRQSKFLLADSFPPGSCHVTGCTDLCILNSTVGWWYFRHLNSGWGVCSFGQCNFLAAAAAKSLQLCPTLCDPIDGSPPGYPVRGILQARILEWVATSFSNAWKWKVKLKSLSRVWLVATSWAAAHQAPLSMGFSRQNYWRGLPLPSWHLWNLISQVIPCK